MKNQKMTRWADHFDQKWQYHSYFNNRKTEAARSFGEKPGYHDDSNY